MALDLFAGISVSDYAAALPWYERLLGSPPTFIAHETEAVWELAEHRYVYIEQQPEDAGHAQHTIFVDDLDAVVAGITERGLEPAKRETYGNGVRKVTYHDPDGNEIGYGGAPIGQETQEPQETPKRRAILSGSTFEEQIGYARAVVDGDWVHVSGTTGYDYATMTISADVAEQAEQCLRNIEFALTEAGCTFADVVRVRYLLTDRADFEPCWPALRRAFGEVRPAATMLVCGLAEPEMKIEIEVYARRSGA
ncbi:Rid family hydrolase [Nonomuraea typhae]|uniref:Rid family hydrolase n=1 Tax=Nonomuraea typhae TaxID=2603600 RepID=UPI001FE38ED6|nr:Rid family hydrolase [Nonomuraea typhae]